MSKETYAFALKNALTEIRNICPDVQTSFLFDTEGGIVAGDAKTPEATVERIVNSMEGILEKSETIGGLNSLVVVGSKGNVHISYVNDLYLTMVSSKRADMKYVETVARVLIPTVMKLLDNLSPAPLRHPTPLRPISPSDTLVEPEDANDDKAQEAESDTETEKEEEKEKTEEGPLGQPELPSSQLIVESFGGLLVRNDTVQISEDIALKWEELLDGEDIELVEVEAFNGKSTQCKVKTLDDSKLENKAIIRIPEKICESLDIRKGELVRVKPLIT